MSKCGKYKYRQYLSRYFDIHVDWEIAQGEKSAKGTHKED